jgi:hypothetical protein
VKKVPVPCPALPLFLCYLVESSSPSVASFMKRFRLSSATVKNAVRAGSFLSLFLGVGLFTVGGNRLLEWAIESRFHPLAGLLLSWIAVFVVASVLSIAYVGMSWSDGSFEKVSLRRAWTKFVVGMTMTLLPLISAVYLTAWLFLVNFNAGLLVIGAFVASKLGARIDRRIDVWGNFIKGWVRFWFRYMQESDERE